MPLHQSDFMTTPWTTTGPLPIHVSVLDNNIIRGGIDSAIIKIATCHWNGAVAWQ